MGGGAGAGGDRILALPPQMMVRPHRGLARRVGSKLRREQNGGAEQPGRRPRRPRWPARVCMWGT